MSEVQQQQQHERVASMVAHVVVNDDDDDDVDDYEEEKVSETATTTTTTTTTPPVSSTEAAATTTTTAATTTNSKTNNSTKIGHGTRKVLKALSASSKATSGSKLKRESTRGIHATKGGSLLAVEQYGSDALVTFSGYIFVREFVYHLLGPLAIPLIYMSEGDYGVRNRSFNFEFSFYSLGGYFLWSMFVALNILYVGWIQGRLDTAIELDELVLVNGYHLCRLVVIGVKYGYLSPDELQSIRTRYLTADEKYQQQLIQGWLQPTPNKILQEIGFALRRTGVHLCALSMYLHFVPGVYATDQSRQSLQLVLERELLHGNHAVLPEEENEENQKIMQAWRDGVSKGFVNVRHMVYFIARRACESGVKLFGVAVTTWLFAVSLLVSLIPLVYRAANGRNVFGDWWPEHAFVVMYVLSSTLVGWTILIYFWVALRDFHRRLVMQRLLTGCLECGRGCNVVSRAKTKQAQWPLPALDYHDAETMLYWSSMRGILKDLGQQFANRVQAYTSFFLLGVVGLLVWLVVTTMTSTPNRVGIIMVLVVILMPLCVMIVLTRMAQKINHVHTEQVSLLARHRLEVLRKVCMEEHPPNSPIVEKYTHAQHMLQAVLDGLKSDDTLNPIRIMGFDANLTFFRFISTLAVLTIIVSAQALQQSHA